MTSIQGNNITVPGQAAINEADVTILILPISSSGVNYAVLSTDEFVLLTATGLTATLPAVASVPIGKTYLVKLTAAGTGTVKGNGAETIDGSNTYSLSAQYKFVKVLNTGSAWLIVGSN